MRDTVPLQDVVTLAAYLYNRVKIVAIYSFLPLMYLVSSTALHATNTQVFVDGKL